jgi:hypothetical protein
MAESRKEYESKPSDLRWGMKDVGRRIEPERFESVIDRIFGAKVGGAQVKGVKS